MARCSLAHAGIDPAPLWRRLKQAPPFRTQEAKIMSIRTIFTSIAALVTAAVISVALGLSIVDSRAEAGCEFTGRNICANEVATGEVHVSWGSLPREAHYRVGWVNMDHFRMWVPEAAPPDEWLNIFNFRDVENEGGRGNGTTIIDLTPGVEYAFIAAPLRDRWGHPSEWGWSDWLYLTMNEELVSCPAGNPGVPANPAAPGATPTQAPWTGTPDPTPTQAPRSEYFLPNSVESSSAVAGAPVGFTVTFGNVQDDMPAGSSVELYLEEPFQVPDSIPAKSIYLTASNPLTAATGNGARRYVTAPIEIDTDFHWWTSGEDDWEIRAYLPSGFTPNEGQTLTLVVEESAGIRNPVSAGVYGVGITVLAGRTYSGGPDIRCGGHDPHFCLTVTGASPTPTSQQVVIEPTPTPVATPTPQPAASASPAGPIDYDTDDDGLIEISNLAQLDAIRLDLRGSGQEDLVAFPNSLRTTRMSVLVVRRL